jgi:hypothetical protein
MEAPSLMDIRKTIARVLEVERGALTEAERSQIAALREVHGADYDDRPRDCAEYDHPVGARQPLPRSARRRQRCRP